MIEELDGGELFSLETNYKRINAPEDTLPCSCYRREGCEYRVKALSGQNTDVSHVSIRVNSDQNVSTSRMLHHESTMSLFRYV